MLRDLLPRTGRAVPDALWYLGIKGRKPRASFGSGVCWGCRILENGDYGDFTEGSKMYVVDGLRGAWIQFSVL